MIPDGGKRTKPRLVPDKPKRPTKIELAEKVVSDLSEYGLTVSEFNSVLRLVEKMIGGTVVTKDCTDRCFDFLNGWR